MGTISDTDVPVQRSNVYGDGIPFVQWWLLWLLGGVVATVSLALDLIVQRTDNMPGRDFTNLWTAGKLVWARAPDCAFNPTCFQISIIQNLHIATLQNYSYPPSALLFAAPFALLPYYAALVAWTVCGMLLFLWAAKSFIPKQFPLYLAVLTPAATINTWNGHYGFVFGSLWLLCFNSIEKRPTLAGIAAGFLTFKPHLGVMIALTVIRKRRVLFATIATTACLVAISSLLFGIETWRAFFTETMYTQSKILTRETSQFYFMMMPSAYVAFGRGTSGLIAQFIASSATILLLMRYRQWNAFSASTATFLILPYSFNYDMTVACLGFAVLLFTRWRTFGRFQRFVMVAAFFSPELVYYIAPTVPFVLFYSLYLQLECAHRPSERALSTEIEGTGGTDLRQASCSRNEGCSLNQLT